MSTTAAEPVWQRLSRLVQHLTRCIRENPDAPETHHALEQLNHELQLWGGPRTLKDEVRRMPFKGEVFLWTDERGHKHLGYRYQGVSSFERCSPTFDILTDASYIEEVLPNGKRRVWKHRSDPRRVPFELAP